jgi:hypothetical protein
VSEIHPLENIFEIFNGDSFILHIGDRIWIDNLLFKRSSKKIWTEKKNYFSIWKNFGGWGEGGKFNVNLLVEK